MVVVLRFQKNRIEHACWRLLEEVELLPVYTMSFYQKHYMSCQRPHRADSLINSTGIQD